MRTTTYKTAALLGALSLGLSACASGQATSGSGEGGSQKVIYTEGAATVTDWDHYVAVDKGLYEENGVELDGVDTQTATAATQLLVTGEANIGRGLPPTIQTVNQSNGGVNLVSVADLLIRPPFVMNAKDIDSWEGLLGKNVGVSSPTDSTAIVTQEAIRQLDLDASQIELIPSGGTGARYAALESGALDAALLLPPVNFTAEDAGYTRIGYVPEDLGSDWQFAFTSVIVDPDWAAENEEAVTGFLAARHEALQWLADPANKEEAVRILSEATEVSEEIATKTYDLMKIGTDESAFADEIGISPEAAGGVLEALKAIDQAPADFTVEDITDDQYAAKVRDGQ